MQMSYQYRRVNDQLVPEALLELGFAKEIGPIEFGKFDLTSAQLKASAIARARAAMFRTSCVS